MRKNVLTEGVAVLLIGIGALAYGCSEDSIWDKEENKDARSLSKRTLEMQGEETESDTDVVYGVEAGSYTGDSNTGKCRVNVSWTRGYTTRSPYSTLTAKASCKNIQAEDIHVTSNWHGFYGIEGTIDYRYKEVVIKEDENGKKYTEVVIRKGSDRYDFSPNITFIDD